MATFTIDGENNIMVHSIREEAAVTALDSFATKEELAKLGSTWPAERLVAIWNSLPGVTPVKRFTDRKTAITRIWKCIQSQFAEVEAEAHQGHEKAKAGAQAAKGAPAKPKPTRKASPPKSAPQTPRDGSKKAQVVALLQRKAGATLSEIMEKMNWQKHTVRGMIAGALKKDGYVVESFKSDKAERTYRVNP